MVKLSDYVIDFFADLGVGHLFVLPGGGCMHLVDSVGRNGRIRFVGCLHEQAAAVAADGYAQYRGDIGVALVTTGPGGTNAVTAVAAAWIDSTPLVVISGQVKRKDMMTGRGVRQMGAQEVDIVSLVKPVTKYAVTVLDPSQIRYHLEKAVFLARGGRPGPVWLDIPLDIQGSSVNGEGMQKFVPEPAAGPGREDVLAVSVDRAASLLDTARRPVVLAGRGVRIAGAQDALISAVEKLKIPLLTTWRMMDLVPEDYGLYFGRPGSIASRGANFIQQNADYILVIGARLDLPQVGYDYSHFAPMARKVIVDIDENELKKIETHVDVPVAADACAFLKAFADRLGRFEPPGRQAWLAKCGEWKAEFPVIRPEYLGPAEKVNTYALVDALSVLLPEDGVVVPGSSGSCAEITAQAFRVKKGQRVVNSPGLGSMGFGLPQAIGVCLASGGKRTVCIVGDGGLQHNIQELETVRRLDVPLKLFVLNNGGYASIRNTHRRFFDGRLVCCDPSSGLSFPDSCRIAEAYGLKSVRISSQRNLREEVRSVLETRGPVLCDVMVDPELQTAPRLSSSPGPDGSMVSRPMEDLWPFLEPDELRGNMVSSERGRA